MSEFADRVAIVTGGGGGIGLALAERLAQQGARVVIAEIDAASLEKAASRIAGAGGAVRARRVDVSDLAAVQELVAEVAAAEGRIDYLFNSAGTMFSGEIQEMDSAQWERIVAVNLWGTIHAIRAAYPRMIEQRSGHLVNIASATGLTPAPLGGAYAMTKHAVVGLSLSLREEAAALGVRVSVACPGFIDTGIFDAAMHGRHGGRWLLGRVPFRPYPAERAARSILRGVERNRATIILPLHAHVLVWGSRLVPGLMRRLAQGNLRRYRATSPGRDSHR